MPEGPLRIKTMARMSNINWLMNDLKQMICALVVIHVELQLDCRCTCKSFIKPQCRCLNPLEPNFQMKPTTNLNTYCVGNRGVA